MTQLVCPSVAMMRAARLLHGDTEEVASEGPDANRLSSSARGVANGEIDAGTTRIHTATHHQVPFASLGSRELAVGRSLTPFPAHTCIGFMTGEGPDAN